MTPETRAFLEAVRTAEDPSAEDERRVLSAVRAKLAAGATLGAGVSAAKAATLVGGGVTSGLKLGGVVLGLGAAAWMAGALLSTGRPLAPATPPPAPPSAVSPAPAVASAAPRLPLPEATPPVAEPSVGRRPGATPARLAPPSLREEIALLAEVHAALERGDGAAALSRLDRHATVDERLLAEREAARVLALCSLGRTQEAERSARVFFREHPTSVQRTAVERSCAGKAIDPR